MCSVAQVCLTYQLFDSFLRLHLSFSSAVPVSAVAVPVSPAKPLIGRYGDRQQDEYTTEQSPQ